MDQPADQERIAKLEDAARRLLPYVQYFGLCGADPHATQAVVDLSHALGGEQHWNKLTADVIQQVKTATIEMCADWLEKHRFRRTKIRNSDMDRLVEELRGLKSEP